MFQSRPRLPPSPPAHGVRGAAAAPQLAARPPRTVLQSRGLEPSAAPRAECPPPGPSLLLRLLPLHGRSVPPPSSLVVEVLVNSQQDWK